jgi:hypothetical protein
MHKQIKIFLPEITSNSDKLLLQGIIKEDQKFYKFFISNYVKDCDINYEAKNLGCLFRISTQIQQSIFDKTSNSLEIYRNENNEIVDIKARINSQNILVSTYMIIQYNPTSFHHLSKNKIENCESKLDFNDFLFLAKLIESEYQPSNLERSVKRFRLFFVKCFITFCNIFSFILSPFSLLFRNSSVCKHFVDWKKNLLDNNSNDGSILFDVIMGIAVFALLNYIHLPGKYFMDLTEVRYFYQLILFTIHINFL